jgi:hypothetical protein
MGLDYSGNYGIGVQVSVPELDEEHEFYEDDYGYIDSLVEQDEDYYMLETGNYDSEKDFYICIKSPFKDGYDITEKVNKFMEFLDSTDLIVHGKVDEVGGLNVW